VLRLLAKSFAVLAPLCFVAVLYLADRHEARKRAAERERDDAEQPPALRLAA